MTIIQVRPCLQYLRVMIYKAKSVGTRCLLRKLYAAIPADLPVVRVRAQGGALRRSASHAALQTQLSSVVTLTMALLILDHGVQCCAMLGLMSLQKVCFMICHS